MFFFFCLCRLCFFFSYTASTEFYSLSRRYALPIFGAAAVAAAAVVVVVVVLDVVSAVLVSVALHLSRLLSAAVV